MEKNSDLVVREIVIHVSESVSGQRASFHTMMWSKSSTTSDAHFSVAV